MHMHLINLETTYVTLEPVGDGRTLWATSVGFVGSFLALVVVPALRKLKWTMEQTCFHCHCDAATMIIDMT